MKLIAYIRTSTEDQNISLEVQAEKIKAYCGLYGHELITVYSDQLSGKTMNREGLKQALAGIKDCDGLIVAKLDRLTRSVRDMAVLLEQFDGTGKHLISVSDQVDTSTASGRLVLNILTSVAQWERETIVERTTQALSQKKNNSERVGHIPFGYQLDSDGIHIVKNEQEQKIIRKIKSLRKSGLSFKKIADFLNNREVTNRGNAWNKNSVRTKIAA